MKRLDYILQSFIQRAAEAPKKSLSLLFLVLLFTLFQAKPFRFLISVDTLINPNFETSQSFRQLKEDFSTGTNLIHLKRRVSGFTPQDLCHTRKWLSQVNLESQYLYSLHSPFTLRKPVLEDNPNGLTRLAYRQLLSLDCYPNPQSEFPHPVAALPPSPWDGLLYQKENHVYMVDFTFKNPGEFNFESHVIPKVVENITQSYEKAPQGQEDVFWIGEAAYQFFMKKGLRLNNLLNGFLLLLIVLLLRFIHGTFLSGALFVLTLILAATFLFSLMAASGTPLDVLNNSLFILLSVASLGDFIFISHHLKQNQTNPIESFKAMALPSFFTSLTTFLGFISLTSSDLFIVQRLGLWAGLSGIIEYIMLFFFLPSFIKLFVKNRHWVRKNASWDKTLNIFQKLHIPSKMGWSLMIIYLIIPFAILSFNINDNPTGLFPPDHPFRRGISFLKEHMGFEGEISLRFKNKRHHEFNKNLLLKLKDEKLVGKIEDPYTMTAFLTDHLPPEESEIVLSSLIKSPSYQRLVTDDHMRAILYLKETNLLEINRLRQKVQTQYCPRKECSLTGSLVAYAEFSQIVPKTLLKSLSLSLILVLSILLFLAFKQKRLPLLRLILASFWGVAFIIILFGFTGLRLNFVTCVVIAILVGMTGDNAIHYLLNHRGSIGDGIQDKEEASITTTFIMSLCCIIFFFFSFEPPRILGLLLILGLWGSLVGDLWLLKSLIGHKKKKAPLREP